MVCKGESKTQVGDRALAAASFDETSKVRIHDTSDTPDLVHDDISPNTSDSEVEHSSDDVRKETMWSHKSPRVLSSSNILPRILLVMLEVFVLVTCLLYLSAWTFQQFHNDYLLPQMKLMTWTEERKERELTYYHRFCYDEDVSAMTADQLIIPPNTTAQECMEHMLTHGVSIYPNVLTSSTTDGLRDYVSNRSHKRERFNVIENESRYSYSLEVDQDPIVVNAMQEIATHPVLRPAIEKIIGPNPAVVEFSDITSTYGSQEQHWHQDVVPDGSAFKYARSFIPSYSLFIPLQDTTAEMGATQVCPGTHVCEPDDDFCDRIGAGLAVSGTANRWQKGTVAMMNQQTQHRGPAHIDPDAPDRVLFVLTLAPRPRFEEMELETRILAQGAAYSINWNNWGFLLDDFANAPKAMQQPWKTFRSLGMFKPRGRLWGWDGMTTILARIVNEEYYFRKDNLEDFLEKGGFWFLPEFLQGRIGVDDDYYDFLFDTFHRVKNSLKSVCLTTVALYAMGLLVATPFFESRRLSRVFRSARRVSLPLLGLFFTSNLSLLLLARSRWTSKINSGKPFNLQTAQRVHDDSPATLPYLHDVLIDTRYKSRYLGSYNHILDSTHPGNVHFKWMVHQYSAGYLGLPEPWKDQLVSTMVQWVAQNSGRLLGQKEDGEWKVLSFSAGKEACHEALLKSSNSVMNEVLTEISFLRSETKFGTLRDAALHRFHIPTLLNSIQHTILHPTQSDTEARLPSLEQALDDVLTQVNSLVAQSDLQDPLHMSFEYLRVQASMNRIQDRVETFRQSMSVTKNAAVTSRVSIREHLWLPPTPRYNRGVFSSSRTTGIPPSEPVEEPYQGAWLKVGDVVEAKYGGTQNEWYRSTIVAANADKGTYDVEHEFNGYIDEDLCRLCVRWYQPPELDDEVRVRVFQIKAYPGQVVAVNDDGTFDITTEKMGVRQNVHPMDIRSFDWTWWIGTNVEIRAEDEAFEGERGVIIDENDGIYDVKLLSGSIERGVVTDRIRPFFP